MTHTRLAGPALSRRNLLKVGLFGSAVLATAGGLASLSGCSASNPASGFSVLRAEDLPFLRAFIPAALAGSVPAEQRAQQIEITLHSIDHSLSYAPAESLKPLLQLFDLLSMPVSRGPSTGIWGSWASADSASVEAFIRRWENSSISLLNMGAATLQQLVQTAWYSKPESWAGCHYPGPPTV